MYLHWKQYVLQKKNHILEEEGYAFIRYTFASFQKGKDKEHRDCHKDDGSEIVGPSRQTDSLIS